jgi:predicted PurR-regulated permease PerM
VKPRLTAFRKIATGDDVVRVAIRFGLLAFLLYWSFVLIRPFIPILVWGIVLAVALYPAFAWLSRILGDRPRLAAVMITLLNLAIVIGPVAWLGVALIGDLKTISDHLSAGDLLLPSPPQGIKDWPLVGEKIHDLWSVASTNSKLPSSSWPRISNRWQEWCSGSPAAPVSAR